MLLIGILLITSCEKVETQDYRNDRIGTYVGEYSIGWYNSDTTTRRCFVKVACGFMKNELAISSLNNQQANLAILDWSSYTYNTFKWSTTTCGTTSEIVFTGKGVFTNDSLFETFTMIEYTNGQKGRQGWAQTKLKKQSI